MNGRLTHLTDQIVAAYQDESQDSLADFRRLTNQASSEMTLNEWKEMCDQIGYDIYSDKWTSLEQQ